MNEHADLPSFDVHIPTRVLFGAGRLKDLGVVPLYGKKALIVISSGTSMRRFGYLRQVQDLLGSRGIDSVVFDRILPNPILDHVTQGAQLAREQQCDFVIGLGGGSSIDSAKSIALMAQNPGNYWDYIHGGSGKGIPVPNGALPIVAITTTAGTGTEVDPWTVITRPETNEKIGFGIPETFPRLAIVDPELMLSVPSDMTLYQGFDAFFHAAEGFIATAASPVSDLFAARSMQLLQKSLAAAVRDGSDLQARTDVALANTLSGFVESTSSCTSEHSLEHALSAFHPNIPHGAGLIMLSEAYFSLFSEKIPERFIELARIMGMDVDQTEVTERPKLFVKALRAMIGACGADTLKMSDFGIREDELEVLAANARETMGGLFSMDRYALSDAECVELLRKSYR
jgi:alcohol dehydrogenase